MVHHCESEPSQDQQAHMVVERRLNIPCPSCQGPTQAAEATPILPNRDNGQEGEEGGENKTRASKLFHGELIDLVIQHRRHHPRQSQRQLQDDEHLSCKKNKNGTHSVISVVHDTE